jgi:glycerophosphoryl diester phosphodiesterase
MKNKHYVVTFSNRRKVFVSCFNKEEAEILSKAIMIKIGFTREITSITEAHDSFQITACDFIA